jgi:hypothetical protein
MEERGILEHRHVDVKIIASGSKTNTIAGRGLIHDRDT